jgi:hypothetical protein
VLGAAWSNVRWAANEELAVDGVGVSPQIPLRDECCRAEVLGELEYRCCGGELKRLIQSYPSNPIMYAYM